LQQNAKADALPEKSCVLPFLARLSNHEWQKGVRRSGFYRDFHNFPFVVSLPLLPFVVSLSNHAQRQRFRANGRMNIVGIAITSCWRSAYAGIAKIGRFFGRLFSLFPAWKPSGN
jgi:hypothetical protein